jgi:hypothetical protein
MERYAWRSGKMHAPTRTELAEHERLNADRQIGQQPVNQHFASSSPGGAADEKARLAAIGAHGQTIEHAFRTTSHPGLHDTQVHRR